MGKDCCPFCGSEDIPYKGNHNHHPDTTSYAKVCHNSECDVVQETKRTYKTTKRYVSKKDFIKKWNEDPHAILTPVVIGDQ